MLTEQIILRIQAKGSKPPFFGIIVPGTNALGYIALARHLAEDQPLYGIQGPGCLPTGRPYSRMEFDNLATTYTAAMKTVQPRGPYFLGGMCEGARIAFDMARLLERQGETVALLAIFDTWVVENSQIRALWKINYYAGRLKTFWVLPWREKQKMMRKVLGNRATRLQAGKTDDSNESPSSWPTTYWPGKDFVPAKFGGKITVIRRQKQPYYYAHDPTLGWGNHTTSDVELHLINSPRHPMLFREPYVRQVAEQLHSCLKRARK